MKFFNKIRTPHKSASLSKKIIFSLLSALLGFALGIYSGFLDNFFSFNPPEIVYILNKIFGTPAFWAFVLLVIYSFSKTPFRAALNAFCIFAGMMIGYCTYSYFITGFTPERSELLTQGFLIVISPVIAVLCWYAKGYGTVSAVLSALIIAFFILQVFIFSGDFSYFQINSGGIEILLLPASIAVLYRKPKQTLISVALAIFISYFIVLLPFSIQFI